MTHGSSALVISRAQTNSLSQALKTWNVNVFSNIFIRKSKCLARLGCIQKCLDRSSNHFLLNLEAGLIKKYANVRDQEVAFWHQNSRDKWLQDEDKLKL
jgi:hypothetical protein